MKINTNLCEKITFIGISLSANQNSESAAAILDKNLKIIKLDKLFTIQDVKFFIDNLPGKKNSLILISIPANETMISSKWKFNSRTYQPVNLNSKIRNKDDWANRFSDRGSEYFSELKAENIDVFRYDLDNVKNKLGFCTPFKDRTPLDCKAIQNSLKMNFNLKELPSNMLPAAQLEAILGALLAYTMVNGQENIDFKTIYAYKDIEVMGFC